MLCEPLLCGALLQKTRANKAGEDEPSRGAHSNPGCSLLHAHGSRGRGRVQGQGDDLPGVTSEQRPRSSEGGVG